MLTTITEAAERRAARDGATRGDRPSRRRADEAGSASPFVRVRSRMELRASEQGAGFRHFTGYASVTEHGYEMWDWAGPYTEIVSAGAFDVSLNRADLDVPLVLQHADLRRIARTTNGTLSLSVDGHGLLVDAPQLDMRDPDVAYIVPKLESRLIDEMSFKFTITRGQWSPDYTEYRIDEVDIHRGDVAIVGYGANPATSGEVRAADLPEAQARRLFDELGARFAPAAPAVVRRRPTITEEDVAHRR